MKAARRQPADLTDTNLTVTYLVAGRGVERVDPGGARDDEPDR
jgi:hypothetical protein